MTQLEYNGIYEAEEFRHRALSDEETAVIIDLASSFAQRLRLSEEEPYVQVDGQSVSEMILFESPAPIGGYIIGGQRPEGDEKTQLYYIARMEYDAGTRTRPPDRYEHKIQEGFKTIESTVQSMFLSSTNHHLSEVLHDRAIAEYHQEQKEMAKNT